jgi:YD repeat-containing protein
VRGLLERVTSPDGAYVNYVYDPAHRLTEIRDTLGNRMVYTLDDIGNRIKEETFDTSGAPATLKRAVFDELNRVHQSIGSN